MGKGETKKGRQLEAQEEESREAGSGQSESRKWAEESKQERLTGGQDGRQEALRAHPCPHKG